MKISVKAKPGSKINKIEVIDAEHFEVWVKEPAIQGRANEAIIKSLAEHFKVSLYQVCHLYTSPSPRD